MTIWKRSLATLIDVHVASRDAIEEVEEVPAIYRPTYLPL